MSTSPNLDAVPGAECDCGRIKVGWVVTDSRNWNPDCLVHGLASDWYRSDEQVAARQEQSDRTVAMQTEARRVRNGGAPKAPCRNCHRQHQPWDDACDNYQPVSGEATA